MSGKRQTTMAKLARERRLQEKREQKAEKKLERKQAAERGEAMPWEETDEVEAGDEGEEPEAVERNDATG